MPKWTDVDTSKYTGDSTSKVSKAEHQARDDAEKSGVFERGNSEKNSQRFEDSKGEARSFWSSIFGSKKWFVVIFNGRTFVCPFLIYYIDYG